MAFNTKSIVKDLNQKPVPQYYNPELDIYQVLEGKNGANKVILYNEAGAAIDLATLINTVVTAINNIYNKDTTKTLYGLSTDTKPTSGNIKGNTFFEIDTSNVFMWNGSAWVVI